MEQEQQEERRTRLETFRSGRDEMNLAEFPLAGVSDRFLSGEKTVVFVDQVWDEEKREHVKRKLSISGSDLYGLPTAKDDDVLLACIQLSSIGDFHQREVHFSRYELLKLLRWPDETKYYRRVATSLRRWKGLTVYSDRAFYDHGRKSWVNRDFGVFDNLYIYEREEREGSRSPAKSRCIWNEVLFESFRAGYIKQLDWDLYLSLKDPVAKRLYRFLDKRFYRQNKVTLDLHELALNKVRLSQNYNTAQMKRALMKGVRELEAVWELQAMDPSERFQKLSRGRWEAVFVKRRRGRAKRVEANPARQDLAFELTKRNVGPATAAELAARYPEERIQSMLELFDWYNSHGQERGAGFLVSGIKSKEPFCFPKGFESKAQGAQRRRAANSRKRAEREMQKAREEKRRGEEKDRETAFFGFWGTLDSTGRESFEEKALEFAERTVRDGYLRSKNAGGVVFEQYRRVILRNFFEQSEEPRNAAFVNRSA